MRNGRLLEFVLDVFPRRTVYVRRRCGNAAAASCRGGGKEPVDYYSIGQCTPGIIAINTATFVGYKLRGVTGAVLTTFGVVAPSIIIITLIAAVLQNFMYDSHVTQAFAGIRIVVVALVAEAVVELWKKGVHGRIGLAVFVLSLFLLVFLHFSPIAVILTASVIGPAYLKWVRK